MTSHAAPRWGAAVMALAVLQACAGATPRAPGGGAGSPGRLVIVGGALQAENAAVYQAVVEGREGEGPICVLPTASGRPAESMDAAVRALTGYAGAGAVKGVLVSTDTPERARDPRIASELSGCSGFFFTGGAQSRIVDVFLPAGDTTVAFRAVRDRWREGAVVAGTSAGAAMMSRVMIAGGGSAEAVGQGVAAAPDAEGLQIRPGMGFFEPIVDQHFLARGRIGRLLVAVAHPDAPRVGLGIDENTALVVDGDSAVVVGASGVVVVDGSLARATADNRASGLRVSLAGAGDVVDLDSFEVRRGGAKVPVPVDGGAPALPEDPFARWAFLHLVADLAGSSDREATFSLPGATLRIAEGEGFSAWATGTSGGVEGTPAGLSAGPFVVDLTPPER